MTETPTVRDLGSKRFNPLNWFLSSHVRHASQMYRHVRRLLSAQRDILTPKAITGLHEELLRMEDAIHANKGVAELSAAMSKLETEANRWLKPYPNAALRENIEVLLVAIAVAMGIRTFFLQPFKIPTGSMQPTLFGITHKNLIDDPDVEIPGFFSGLFQYWINGVSYKVVTAKASGRLEEYDEQPVRFLLFNLKQKFRVGSETYTVWFPPENFLERAGLVVDGTASRREFKAGEPILKLRVISGDHLFVDRMTYNFRRPKRGEIIVFETRGISRLPQDQYYIKRMVAMGGERVQIGDDRHLVIDGHRLDASTPRFELVYSFGDRMPMPSRFSGHVNQTVARALSPQFYNLAPNFPNQDSVYTVPAHHYMVMGDNTLNSSDSRSWGDFPRENVIGKSYFVYWPIGAQEGPEGYRTSRFGWSHR